MGQIEVGCSSDVFVFRGGGAILRLFLLPGFSGGATAFPRLGLEWTGQPGDALFFTNTDSAGQPLAAMWHAGLPVTSGRKLLLSKWIRADPLDLTGPPGRPF